MRKLYFAGIDPGAYGFLSIIEVEEVSNSGEYLEKVAFSQPIPFVKVENKRRCDPFAFRDMLIPFCEKIHLAVLEKQQPYPKEGVVSAGATVGGYRIIEGILVGMRIRYLVVSPRTWQKSMIVEIPEAVKNPKEASVLVAKRLFPTVNMKASARCKKDHDGKADSILLAAYGFRYCTMKGVLQ